MSKVKTKKEFRKRRHMRLRQKISGTAARPRLSVCKSNLHITAQVIDDVAGVTIVSANTMEKDFQGKGNIAGATEVGRLIAERAKVAGITEMVFDRGGFPFHGKIKAVAEAVREAGLKL